MSEFDRVGDFVFSQFAGADFDHVHEVLGAGDDQVHVAVFELLLGRVEDQFAIDPADANVSGRG